MRPLSAYFIALPWVQHLDGFGLPSRLCGCIVFSGELHSSILLATFAAIPASLLSDSARTVSVSLACVLPCWGACTATVAIYSEHLSPTSLHMGSEQKRH